MSTTILRTVDAWWVDTCVGAAHIDTDATTLVSCSPQPEKIHAARLSRQTVDPATLELVSPVTAPCRVVAQMTNYASHVKDAGLKPETIPLTFFRKTSGSISGPNDDIVRPGHVRFLDYEVEVGVVIGRELPVGTQVTADNWATFVAGLVVTNDVSARDVQLPKTQFFESKSYPTLHPRRAGAGAAGRERAQAVRRPSAAAVGERRDPSGRPGRPGHDLLAAAGAGGVEPVPAARPGRPAADRHPGGDRVERAGETGADHQLTAAGRDQMEDVLQTPGPEPEVPQGRRRRRDHHRHRRRCDRPRAAAHGRSGTSWRLASDHQAQSA